MKEAVINLAKEFGIDITEEARSIMSDSDYRCYKQCITLENLIEKTDMDEVSCEYEFMWDFALSMEDEDLQYDIIGAYADATRIENDGDMIKAYAYAGMSSSRDMDDIIKEAEEAYQGRYDDDADFAEATYSDYYEEIPDWVVVDWRKTAEELMCDYTESNGYYFRNL